MNINLHEFFDVDGIQFDGGPVIASGDLTPDFSAPIGSIYLCTSGDLWKKQGPLNSDWVNTIPATPIVRETPAGLIDGVNNIFTLQYNVELNKESIYVNGLLLNSGVDNDYTISLNTITFNFIPQINDTILVTYFKPDGSTPIIREVPVGLIDGSNTQFTLSYVPVINKESVYVNGLLMASGPLNNYTIIDNKITFKFAPQVGDVILVSYYK
jgi:hypothetical protein